MLIFGGEKVGKMGELFVFGVILVFFFVFFLLVLVEEMLIVYFYDSIELWMKEIIFIFE